MVSLNRIFSKDSKWPIINMFFFELGGLNATGLGWFGSWFYWQLVKFAREGRNVAQLKHAQ